VGDGGIVGDAFVVRWIMSNEFGEKM